MVKDEKKRRVIHTRVSEDLDEELREKASSLGVSVSNLVRHVLTNTLDLVEGIVTDSASVARSARGEAAAAGNVGDAGNVGNVANAGNVGDDGKAGFVSPVANVVSADAPIIAWQRAVLNLNAVCSGCNDILPKGTEAGIGITDRPGPKPVLCTACMEKLNEQDTSSVTTDVE